MTASAWFLFKVYILSNSTILFSVLEIKIYLLLKVIINVVGIVVSSALLEEKDGFVSLFGNVFHFASLVGEYVIFKGGDVFEQYKAGELNLNPLKLLSKKRTADTAVLVTAVDKDDNEDLFGVDKSSKSSEKNPAPVRMMV